MIYIQQGLYVVIEQLEKQAAPPFPFENGFSRDVAYLVLGVFSLSETGEAYFILSNDRDEIWFISNRHLRTYKVIPDSHLFRIYLPKAKAEVDSRVNKKSSQK